MKSSEWVVFLMTEKFHVVPAVKIDYFLHRTFLVTASTSINIAFLIVRNNNSYILGRV